MDVHSPVTAYYSCNTFLDPPSQETIDGIEEERHEKEQREMNRNSDCAAIVHV
jgi:hypothetical protein